jgi:hypothetical protein
LNALQTLVGPFNLGTCNVKNHKFLKPLLSNASCTATPGLKAFLMLRDASGDGALWASMTCRACGHAQEHPAAKAAYTTGGARVAASAGVEGENAAGAVMTSVGSRSSLECGCMRRWVVQIEGVAHRFCSGCKLYHVLTHFDKCGSNDKSGKKPSKVCTWFKERRKQRKMEAAEVGLHTSREYVALACPELFGPSRFP